MDKLQRVRFMINRYYRYRERTPILAVWHIEEVLTPSPRCVTRGMYWYDGRGH